MNKLSYCLFFWLCLAGAFCQEAQEPQEAPAKELTQEMNYWDEFSKMLFFLGLIVLSLLVLAWLSKQVMHTREEQLNKTNSIKVLEKRALSQKSMAYLVEVPGKMILVGESPSGLKALCEMPLIESFELNRSPEKSNDA